MTTNRDLRVYQFGRQAAFGTAVAATSKMAIVGFDVGEDDENIARPRLALGRVVRNPGAELAVQHGSVITIPDTPIIYEQLQHLLEMAIVGGVAAAESPATVFTWTFTRDMLAAAAPRFYTFERRLTDGATPKDLEIPDVFCQKITFKGSRNSPLMISAELRGRRAAENAITAALAFPDIEIPPYALGTLFIDDDWGSLGGTQVSNQILDFEISFSTGFIPVYTADGRVDLDLSVVKVNGEETMIDATITALVGAQYVIEKAKAKAIADRAVAFVVEGTEILATGANRSLTLNMMVKHEKPDLLTIGEEDGQDIVEFKFQETGDDAANLFEAILVNAIGTYV